MANMPPKTTSAIHDPWPYDMTSVYGRWPWPDRPPMSEAGTRSRKTGARHGPRLWPCAIPRWHGEWSRHHTHVSADGPWRDRPGVPPEQDVVGSARRHRRPDTSNAVAHGRRSECASPPGTGTVLRSERRGTRWSAPTDAWGMPLQTLPGV